MTDTKQRNTGNGTVSAIHKKKAGPIAAAILLGAALLALFAVFVVRPVYTFRTAEKLFSDGETQAALEELRPIYNYKKAAELYRKAATAEGDRLLAEGDRIGAAIYLTKAGRTLEAEQIFDFSSVVTGCSYVTAAIGQDGKTYYASDRDGDDAEKGAAAMRGLREFLPGTAGINGIDQFGFLRLYSVGNYGISVSQETEKTLRTTGGVKAMLNDTCQETGERYTVLLTRAGSVKVLSDGAKTLTSTGSWSGITSLTDGYRKIFGIDSSGILHIAYESTVPSSGRYDTAGWPKLRKAVETGKALIGLTLTGEVTAAYAGTDRAYEHGLRYARSVTDIATNSDILVLVRKNGSPKAIRVPNWLSDVSSSADKYIDRAVDAVNSWDGIVRLRFAANGIYGIRFDGTVKYVSCDISYDSEKQKFIYDQHSEISAQVKTWTDIVDVISCRTHAIGVRSDGTLRAAGDGTYLESLIGSTGITKYIKRSGGTYIDVDGWKLW